MRDIELKITADNSHTIFVKELNETYHSINGAINESNHVFIKAGLTDYLAKNGGDHLNVFEVGFGTGLNSHLTNLFAQANHILVSYTSVELYPLQMDLISQLNYVEENTKIAIEFYALHHAEWNEMVKINSNFKLKKLNNSLINISLNQEYDVIFFDAFAPDVQPEMWSKSIFEKMYHCLNHKGFLVTYCAKGIVKRTLKEVGFTIENLPGSKGKREMIRAIKNVDL